MLRKASPRLFTDKVMQKRTRNILIGSFLAIILLACAIGGAFYYYFMAPQFFPPQTAYVYIDRDDTADSVYVKVEEVGHVKDFHGFKWMSEYRHYPESIRTGRYEIRNGESVYHVFSRIWRGYQTPMNITINSARTMKRLAGQVGRQLMIDSVEIATLMYDSAFQAKMGYTKETMPALFIPDTYEMYWDISVNEFFDRMRTEHKRFWSTSRTAKAKEMGLTENEVATLASIVEEETNNNPEKPAVAGLYYNRLRIGMPLQADPTIKFALQEFGIRRILNSDLNVESPYNTYLHKGLPPGPIRIPSVTGLDAVLNYAHHNYLYMCAKEDFSGTHNFAVTYREHVNNAQRYWAALNKRKIKR